VSAQTGHCVNTREQFSPDEKTSTAFSHTPSTTDIKKNKTNTPQTPPPPTFQAITGNHAYCLSNLLLKHSCARLGLRLLWLLAQHYDGLHVHCQDLLSRQRLLLQLTNPTASRHWSYQSTPNPTATVEAEHSTSIRPEEDFPIAQLYWGPPLN